LEVDNGSESGDDLKENENPRKKKTHMSPGQAAKEKKMVKKEISDEAEAEV